MYKITVTTGKDTPLTIYFSNNISVIKKDHGCCIMDGLHNNGGWLVTESYDEVISKIDTALKMT